MITPVLYVIDTNSIVAYFSQVFATELQLSRHATKILETAINPRETSTKISIPSVVFVEIFEKWFRDEEFARKFYYEVFVPINESPNVEIKPIDREVLQEISSIGGELESHDLHDKIILASAISLCCGLITTDEKLTLYVDKTHIITEVLC